MHPAHRLLQALSTAVADRDAARPLCHVLHGLAAAAAAALEARWVVIAELTPGEDGQPLYRCIADQRGPAAHRTVQLHHDLRLAVERGRMARHQGEPLELVADRTRERTGLLLPLCVDGEPVGALVAGGPRLAFEQTGPLRWVFDSVATWLVPQEEPMVDPDEVAQLQLLNVELRDRVGQLARLDREHKLLADLGGFLQACHGVDDVHDVLQRFLPVLFEDSSGAWFARSGTLLEQEVGWGRCAHDGVHGVDDCWALRRGEVHEVQGGQGLACGHRHQAVAGRAFCLPVMSREGPVGLLHVEVPEDGEGEHTVRRRLEAVGDRLGACLSNLQLRERLRQESIRDPLTGLFNRRYMVETLLRELGRARRASEPVAVVMMDVDHFKRLNDRYGHDVGDDVLVAVAGALSQGVRSEDVVCRYGGEEFVAILPGADLALATQRAEELRLALHGMAVQARDGSTPTVSLSAGVAVAAPGATPEVVLRAADRALLRAKTDGRDRVCVAEGPVAAVWERPPATPALRAIVR
jgi:diguanylate cyclase (GGDEF)-like protein